MNLEQKEAFAMRLIKLREEKNLTQQELADETQILRVTIAKYESQKRIPSFEDLTTLAKYFNTSTDYFLGLSNNKSNTENYDDITIAEIAKKTEKLTGLNQNTIVTLTHLNLNEKEYIEVINELFEHKEILLDFLVSLYELASCSYVSLKNAGNDQIRSRYWSKANECRYRLHLHLEKLLNVYDYNKLYSVLLAPYAELELNEVRKEQEHNVNNNPKNE